MRFSTVFTVFACGTAAMAAAIAPEAIASRGLLDSLTGIIGDLSGAVDGILFDGCKKEDCTVDLVQDLVGVVDEALGLVTGLVGTVTGVVDGLLSNDIADVTKKIANKMDAHKKSCKGKCGDYKSYSKVDDSLSNLLQEVGDLVPGLLDDVADLLSPVTDLLDSLGLTLVTSLLSSVLGLVGGLLDALL